MKDLLEAGVHFGHQTKRWNPKMKRFIFTKRKGIHIIDLQKTVQSTDSAYKFVKEEVSKGKTVLFVGTKKQAQEEVKKAAEKCEMPYIVLRWLGGMLTNFVTVKNSITRLKNIEKTIENDDKGNLTKREILSLTREREKLNNVFSGIKDMDKLPDILFVIDTEKEDIAVKEATHLNLPIVGVVDTNGDPEHINYPIPGNDDAIRAINLFANLIADAVLAGKKDLQIKKEGEDIKAAALVEGAGGDIETEIIKEKYSEYEIEDDEKKISSFEKFEKTEETEPSDSKEEEKNLKESFKEKKEVTVKEKTEKKKEVTTKENVEAKVTKAASSKVKKEAPSKEKAKEKKEASSDKKKNVKKSKEDKSDKKNSVSKDKK